MGKNPNGAGTLYREAGRGWCSEAFVNLPDGRRKRVRGRGASAEAAIRDRLDRQARLMDANPAADDLLVRQLAERWTGSAHARRWSAETKRSYETALRLHILPEVGGARVALVRALDVQRVLDSTGTVSVANRCRRVMHAMFARAVEWGVLRHNPVASVRSVRLERKERGWWTREQAEAFLAATRKSPYRDLFHAALTTGLRIGELVALRWVDFDGEAFHVRRTYSQSALGRVQEHPKSKLSRRSVPVPPDLAAQLEARRGEGLVFASRTGRLINPGNVRRSLHRYARKAGVPPIRVHDLRRTYASLLAEDGYHPSVIQRLLGHSSPDLALRVYTSVSASRAATAVVRLGGDGGGNLTRQGAPESAEVTPPGGSANGP